MRWNGTTGGGRRSAAIVGAGMAGLACAETLADEGWSVTLFDKGARPGGRMSTRDLSVPGATATGPTDVGFDYGAQYIAVRDAAFRARVARWHGAGLAARWPAAGADAWVGTPGMSALIDDMAARFDVRWSTRVDAIALADGGWRALGVALDEGGFDAMVVAVPAEQVGFLVEPFDRETARLAATTPSQPCWTLMAAFPERLDAADIVKDRGIVAWAARDGAKPGRGAKEAWVVQASAAWSSAHLEADRDSVTSALLAGFADAIGVHPLSPLASAAHRWRYAKSGSAGLGCVWRDGSRLGVCGDWLVAPRVEAAWLSGTALAGRILATAPVGGDGLEPPTLSV